MENGNGSRWWCRGFLPSQGSTTVPPCPWPAQLGGVAEDTVQSLQWAMKQLQVQVGALIQTTHEHSVQLVRESFCLQLAGAGVDAGSVFPTGHGRR